MHPPRLPTTFPILFPFLTLLLLLLTHPAHSKEQTLTDLAAFNSQRTCAKTCFGNNFLYTLGGKLGCERTPYVTEECICRTDLKPGGLSYIRECTTEKCDQNTVDIEAAVKLYDDYCNNAAAAAAGVATTGGANSVTSQAPAAATSFTTSTTANPKSNNAQTTGASTESTSKPEASGDKKYGGLSKAELIGVIVASVGVAVAVVGVCIAANR